ncbi:hypothetical protein [Actinoplanes sp. NPDC026619]|uniref:hypothetical protein n=1 Tax=Actinoplanes sp. NPDC026619 TaxID=3155798 RepID=UPI0033F3AD75
MNALFPENHAAYWSFNYTVRAGLHIRIDGEFPDSRFMSLSVYKGEGGAFSVNGVESTLTDFEIRPDAGTANPWRTRGAAPGAYTVDLVSLPSAGDSNVLPVAPLDTPEGALGRLIFRVYLPASGDWSSVVLPTVTITDASSSPLPDCSDAVLPAEALAAAAGLTGAAEISADVLFVRPPADLGLLPNTDTGYLAVTTTPPAGDQVLVIRGHGATSADGVHPQVWPRRGVDLRYWSLCTNLDNAQRSLVANPLPDGTVDYGCRNDDETTLDRHGFYTYVVGTETQRARIEAIAGVTFVPWSAARPAAPHVLFLRDMLADSGFREAIQNVTAINDADGARKVMREYYPETAITELAGLEAGHSCFTTG